MGINSLEDIERDAKKGRNLDPRAVNTQHRAHIADSNMSKVIGILQDMYAEPITASIREYVSNGYDAHVDAGVKDKPVIVSLSRDINNQEIYNISVKDQGKGMSFQSVIDCFVSYAESSKDNDTSSIGGFGLGSKSGLAYSKELNVETIKFDENRNEYEVTHLVVYSGGADSLRHEWLSSLGAGQTTGTKVSMKASANSFQNENITFARLAKLFGGLPANSVEINKQVVPSRYSDREKSNVIVRDIEGIPGGEIHVHVKDQAAIRAEEEAEKQRSKNSHFYNKTPEKNGIYIAGLFFNDNVASKVNHLASTYDNIATYEYYIPAGVLKLSATRDNIQNTDETQKVIELLLEASSSVTLADIYTKAMEQSTAFREGFLDNGPYHDTTEKEPKAGSVQNFMVQGNYYGNQTTYLKFSEFDHIFAESERPYFMKYPTNEEELIVIPLSTALSYTVNSPGPSVTTLKGLTTKIEEIVSVEKETKTIPHHTGNKKAITLNRVDNAYYAYNHKTPASEYVFATYNDETYNTLAEPISRTQEDVDKDVLVALHALVGYYRKTAAAGFKFDEDVKFVVICHEKHVSDYTRKYHSDKIFDIAERFEKAISIKPPKAVKKAEKTYTIRSANQKKTPMTASQVKAAYENGKILGYAEGSMADPIMHEVKIPGFHLTLKLPSWGAFASYGQSVVESMSSVEIDNGVFLHINKGRVESTLQEIGVENMNFYPNVVAEKVASHLRNKPGVKELNVEGSDSSRISILKTLTENGTNLDSMFPYYKHGEGWITTSEYPAPELVIPVMPLSDHAGKATEKLTEIVKEVMADMYEIGCKHHVNNNEVHVKKKAMGDYLQAAEPEISGELQELLDNLRQYGRSYGIDINDLYRSAFEVDFLNSLKQN